MKQLQEKIDVNCLVHISLLEHALRGRLGLLGRIVLAHLGCRVGCSSLEEGLLGSLDILLLSSPGLQGGVLHFPTKKVSRRTALIVESKALSKVEDCQKSHADYIPAKLVRKRMTHAMGWASGSWR